MNTPLLSDLEEFARGAGEILRQGFIRRPGVEGQQQVDHKGVIDLVTEVDRASERFLLRQIQAQFPGQRVVAEESGTQAGDDCCQWFVDPLDGTVNFAHGVPIFSVSLAYAEDGQVQLGVVYDPLQDECFSAERSTGALLNSQPVRASSTESLDQSLLVTGFPYDIRTNPNNNLDHYTRFALRSQGVRRLGSAALDLCYVAAGRFDGFWELRLSAWDVAAGGLIAECGGALVTDLIGDAEYLKPPYSILAANPFLHPQMLRVLHGSN